MIMPLFHISYATKYMSKLVMQQIILSRALALKVTIMNKKLVVSFVFVTLFFKTACRKKISEGTLIQASGYVIDSVKNKRLPNVKIFLFGGKATFFYGMHYTEGPLDSAMSDNNGNFSLTYNAEGNSIDYALTINYVQKVDNTSQVNYVMDFNHPLYKFNYGHELTNVAISARELNYARVNLKIDANPYDTLYFDMYSNHGEFTLRNRITGTKADTSFLTRYLPNATNYFDYRILSAPKRAGDSAVHRDLSDSIPPGANDTIMISKTIHSTYDLPLKFF